jgi:hypothetical protein
MRRLSIVLLALFLSPLSLIAGQSDMIIDARFVRMQIDENGRRTNFNMVVDLSVVKQDGSLHAIWNSVFIMPDELHGSKNTVLRADHYSTENGGIQNLIIHGKTVSFDLVRSPDRKVKIICMKKDENIYDLKGTSFYWSELLKKRFTEVWSVTNKIILPSLKVYGQGD